MNTIAAISTPDAPGGIAVIRISGDRAIEIAAELFQPFGDTKVTQMRGYTCAYGRITDGENVLDDAVLTVFRAPHSYTGEDVAELSCHGGLYLTRSVLGLVYRRGAEPAGPGEFTKRAFLNDKLSLSQAEAVMELIAADGETALRQARLAKDGRLGAEMREVSTALVELIAAIAYWLDDAEECPPELERTTLTAQIAGIRERLRGMSARYQSGKIYREGIPTVLLGRPNAGKSAVMNWLCGMQRSIVTDIAGTTRDVVTEQVKIDEFTLVLHDTAGLRETENPIEQIGIQQAYKAAGDAQLVLYVVDSDAGLTDEDKENLAQLRKTNVLLLWNKTDLSAVEPPALDIPVLACAALHERDTAPIAAKLREIFVGAANFDDPGVINERQNALICQAADHLTAALALIDSGAELDLLSLDLESAASALRRLEGSDITADVIDTVFSKFCVGK